MAAAAGMGGRRLCYRIYGRCGDCGDDCCVSGRQLHGTSCTRAPPRQRRWCTHTAAHSRAKIRMSADRESKERWAAISPLLARIAGHSGPTVLSMARDESTELPRQQQLRNELCRCWVRDAMTHVSTGSVETFPTLFARRTCKRLVVVSFVITHGTHRPPSRSGSSSCCGGDYVSTAATATTTTRLPHCGGRWPRCIWAPAVQPRRVASPPGPRGLLGQARTLVRFEQRRGSVVC